MNDEYKNLSFFDEELRIRHTDGTLRWLWVRTFPIKDENGKVVRRVGIAEDITERKNYQVELENYAKGMELKSIELQKEVYERIKTEKLLILAKEEAEKANRAKSEFLANMSHEIRTPMNSIMGFAELLKPYMIDNRSKSFLNGILSGGKILLYLINDILDLSKIDAGKMELRYEPNDILKLVHDFRHIFSNKAIEKGLDFNISIKDSVPRFLIIDEVRIRQVLFNILGNAFKFTDNGSVSLQLSALPYEHDSSKVNLIFEVKDTGIGISKDQYETIFESFKQHDSKANRKFGGTGLGLTITRRLVEMMNGKIEVESEVGIGSIFRIFINGVNISSFTNHFNELELGNEKISFHNQSILVAEDIESNKEVIRGFLAGMNVTLIFANNGEEAVSLAKKIIPDLIIMDIMMPILDGYQAIEIIKEDSNLKNIPIIALTASVMEKDEGKVKKICNSYLKKPIDKNDLLLTLKKYLSYQVVKEKDLMQSIMSDLENQIFTSNEYNDFCNEFLPLWKEIEPKMINLQIQEFANKMISYSKSKRLPQVEHYSKTLFELADSFEIDKMNELFKKFPDIIKEMKVLK